MTLAFAFNIMWYIPPQNPTKGQLFMLFQLNKLQRIKLLYVNMHVKKPSIAATNCKSC